MKKFKVITTRRELAIYYGVEYGVKLANKMLKRATRAVQPGFYIVESLRKSGLKRDAQDLKDRMIAIVAGFKAIKSKRLNSSINIYIEAA